jgi:hypothetical protein
MDTSELRLPDRTLINAGKSPIKIKRSTTATNAIFEKPIPPKNGHMKFVCENYFKDVYFELTSLAHKREAGAAGAGTCVVQIHRGNTIKPFTCPDHLKDCSENQMF